MDSMFWGSRAPWGRSEDRCDGAGSEADGAKPPVKPGQKKPVLGVLVFLDRSALVKLRSSGLRIDKARRSPGRICPALVIDLRDQSSESRVRVRSATAFHIGGEGLLKNPRMLSRQASEGPGDLRARTILWGESWGAAVSEAWQSVSA